MTSRNHANCSLKHRKVASVSREIIVWIEYAVVYNLYGLWPELFTSDFSRSAVKGPLSRNMSPLTSDVVLFRNARTRRTINAPLLDM